MLTIFKDWKKSTRYKECMSYQGKRDKKQGGHPAELLENHAPTKGLALDSFTVNSFQDLKKKKLLVLKFLLCKRIEDRFCLKK